MERRVLSVEMDFLRRGCIFVRVDEVRNDKVKMGCGSLKGVGDTVENVSTEVVGTLGRRIYERLTRKI